MDGSIVSFNPTNKDHIEAIAYLHENLLPDSLVTGLGRYFMEHYYYSVLPKMGLIKCDLFIVEGKYIGLSVYTLFPFDFMAQGFKKGFPTLILSLFVAILLKPTRIMIIIDVLREGKKRKSPVNNNKMGELLSLAFLPLYNRTQDIESKLRISDAFYNKAIEYLKANGCEEVQASVKKSNKIALRFHQRHRAVIDEEASSSSSSYRLIRKL